MILPGLQVEKNPNHHCSKVNRIIIANKVNIVDELNYLLLLQYRKWTLVFLRKKSLSRHQTIFWTLLNHRTLHEVACIACSWPAAFTQAVEPSRSCRKLGPQRELVFLLFNNLEISAHTLNVGLTPGSNKNYDQGSRLIWTIFSQCPPRNLLLNFVYSTYRLK